MVERLPAHLAVAALLRRANDSGGMGMVLARGDAQGGTILILAAEKGSNYRFLEQQTGLDGVAAWVRTGPGDANPEALHDYWRRRRARDPDLWVIELDVPQAERFAAETTGSY